VINRRDASTIPAGAEHKLLATYGLSDTKPMAVGTEAVVYALGDDRVLKVYADPTQRDVLDTLREFHDRLDTSGVPWTVPRIHSITRHGELLAVVEDRVPGTTMDTHALGAEDPELEQLYLQTARQIGTLKVDPPLRRRRLLPAPGTTPGGDSDWNAFITSLVAGKLLTVAPILRGDIPDIDTRAEQLLDRFTGLYDGPESVVHGDFYPGNILMTDRASVSGVIDFGSFTMIGDPLYDLATACAFWRMYEPDHRTARNRLLAAATAGLPAQHHRRLLDYLLVAALTTCDLYPEPDRPIQATGHYQWARDILRDNTYWQLTP